MLYCSGAGDQTAGWLGDQDGWVLIASKDSKQRLVGPGKSSQRRCQVAQLFARWNFSEVSSEEASAGFVLLPPHVRVHNGRESCLSPRFTRIWAHLLARSGADKIPGLYETYEVR
jgi:hypothetical protein